MRIRDSKSRVDAVNSLPSGKEEGHRVHEMVVSSAVEDIFNETAMHPKATTRNHLAKANTTGYDPRVRAKERVKRTRENPKESRKVPLEPKVRTSVKPQTLVYLALKTRNQRQVQKLENLHRRITLTILTGTILGLMMTGVRLDGMKVGIKLVRSLEFGVMGSPKRFEWVKMNLDTGAAVNTCPLNFGPGGAGDGLSNSRW